MKRITLLLATLLITPPVFAEIRVVEEKKALGKSTAYNRAWYRDGWNILTEMRPNIEENFRYFIFRPFEKKEANVALVITMEDGHITTIGNGPALQGYNFNVEDFTQDGIPDIIQFKKINKGTHPDLIEGFTIIDGVVEPLPDSFFVGLRGDLLYDDTKKKVLSFLNQKLEPVASGQRR